MAEGWIKLYRKISQSIFWADKPFDRARAWIDLLLMANHEDNKFLHGNEFIEVKRGSFITSEHKLMDRWGWSKTKVRSFLAVLEQTQMLIKKTDHKKTTLTIINYSVYQDSQTTEEPVKDQKKTSKKPVKDPNKNEKNDKEKEDMSNDISAKQKTADPAVKRVIDYYFQKFFHAFGEKPVIDGKKDGSLIKGLLGTYGEERLKGLIDAFFESTDQFIQNSGYTIGLFKTQVNKLITESQRPAGRKQMSRAMQSLHQFALEED